MAGSALCNERLFTRDGGSVVGTYRTGAEPHPLQCCIQDLWHALGDPTSSSVLLAALAV